MTGPCPRWTPIRRVPDEDEKARVDREPIDLLNELRVASRRADPLRVLLVIGGSVIWLWYGSP